MLAVAWFQALLNSIGWAIAKLYDVLPNYGVDIILLTVIIRLVLLPLGIKQIKSMQAMQAIQPKIKELQKKYKGNKQKQQEETMKLYQQAGVNPLGGCLPLLLQFPFLIAMYAVIRPPQLLPTTDPQTHQAVYEVHNNHLPVQSTLLRNVITHQDTDFLYLNLQCSAQQSGTQAVISDTSRKPVVDKLPILNSNGDKFAFAPTSRAKINCGTSPVVKIPYFLFLAAMVGTTFYQQRQMQQITPAGGSSQQQAILKVMPLMFGVFGFLFPSGLVVYWTTSNLWQIGQQWALLRAGHIGPEALERRRQQMEAEPPKQKGFLSRMMEQAQEQSKTRREQAIRGETTMRKPGSGRKPSGSPQNPRKKKRPGPGGTSGGKGSGSKRPKR